MKIIVTTDGSEFSRAAVEKCCQIIAAPSRTSVKIVSVYEVLEPLDISISPEFSRELESLAEQKARESAEQAVAEIKSRFPEIDISALILTGVPEEILIKTAGEWLADIIVIGSQGRGFWERMLLGSVTDSLVHNAPCSVLVARKTKNENNQSLELIK